MNDILGLSPVAGFFLEIDEVLEHLGLTDEWKKIKKEWEEEDGSGLSGLGDEMIEGTLVEDALNDLFGEDYEVIHVMEDFHILEEDECLKFGHIYVRLPTNRLYEMRPTSFLRDLEGRGLSPICNSLIESEF